MTEGLLNGAAVQLPGVRKKFATPPVKVACLSCRSSRTRCNGGQPCASCEAKGKECVYKPSRRGGARVRGKRSSANGKHGHSGDEEHEPENQHEVPVVPPKPLPVEEFIGPGAGLSFLQDGSHDSDSLFDSLFTSPDFASSGNDDNLSDLSAFLSDSISPCVRTYADDSALIDAYYIFIHPYFPILPAPSSIPRDQPTPYFQSNIDEAETTNSSSPIALAISAILALIPYPSDINFACHESVLFRRRYSQFLAQSAIEAIEYESELPDSSTDPSKALESSSEPFRPPFHAGLPIELETIVALNLLSVIEYAQRGNLKKMQGRAGQALVSAMSMSLHMLPKEDRDEFAEARRRVWWMTYISVGQASIVGNTKPTFDSFVSSFTTPFPQIRADPEAFSVYVQSQQAILTATTFVIELNKAMASNADMAHVYSKMQELEDLLGPLNVQADSWCLGLTISSAMDPTEAILSRSLRCMARLKLNSARIKLHRYCAFYDTPVFSGKHCDLQPLPKSTDENEQSQEPRLWPTCNCTATEKHSPESHGYSTPSSATSGSQSATFPFSSHHSARICLKSALNIAESFESLPYPNVTGEPGQMYLSASSLVVAPRTMPTFACCSMQCAYALLMIFKRTKTLFQVNGPSNGVLVDSLLVTLQQGLTSILGSLDNYAVASEALGGMRDQIRVAVDTLMGPMG